MTSKPEDAFEQLQALPMGSTLLDLQEKMDLPLALLFEWSEHFQWQERLEQIQDQDSPFGDDPRVFKLQAVTQRALEITATMLAGGGQVHTNSLMPTTLDVPALALSGGTKDLIDLSNVTSRLIEKSELLAGHATARHDVRSNSRFEGLSDDDLILELQRITPRIEQEKTQ